jgi:polar amino acid transport system substrate-binding protein
MKEKLLFLVCLFALTGSIPVFAQTDFDIMAEELPPFNFEKDGMVQGISADVLVRLFEDIGTPLDRASIKIVPWARGYEAVQNEPGSVLFSMARTEKRETLFKWVGPITELTLGLIAPKEKHIVINTIEDANNYKIGTIREGAPEQLAIEAGVDTDSLDRISRPDLNIKKLQAGRIDMFAFNVPTTFYMMLQTGLNPEDYEVVYTLKETALYFAFHKETDEEFIAKMNDALKALRDPDTDGKSEIDRIREQYLGPQG